MFACVCSMCPSACLTCFSRLADLGSRDSCREYSHTLISLPSSRVSLDVAKELVATTEKVKKPVVTLEGLRVKYLHRLPQHSLCGSPCRH